MNDKVAQAIARQRSKVYNSSGDAPVDPAIARAIARRHSKGKRGKAFDEKDHPKNEGERSSDFSENVEKLRR